MMNNLYDLDVVQLRLVKERSLYSEEQICNPQKAVDAFAEYLDDMPQEYFCSINFDESNHPINASICSMGTVNQTMVCPGELLKTALLSNASNIIVLHNHPSGDVTPSNQDIATTQKLIEICKLVEIEVNDHIIVGHNKIYHSMREHEDVKEWEKDQEVVKETPSKARGRSR